MYIYTKLMVNSYLYQINQINHLNNILYQFKTEEKNHKHFITEIWFWKIMQEFMSLTMTYLNIQLTRTKFPKEERLVID